jgi:hypothetical protein
MRPASANKVLHRSRILNRPFRNLQRARDPGSQRDAKQREKSRPRQKLQRINFAQQAPNAEADASVRLEARLQPVIAADASGQARLDIEAGRANDRFTAEVEIAKADSADLGITRGNGWRDDVVELRVLRGGGADF